MVLFSVANPWAIPIAGANTCFQLSTPLFSQFYIAYPTILSRHSCFHHRRNAYDGEEEFWVVVRESGKRTEESSWEHQHQKRQKARLTPCTFFLRFAVPVQADTDPTSEVGTEFTELDAMKKRTEDLKSLKEQDKGNNKFAQD